MQTSTIALSESKPEHIGEEVLPHGFTRAQLGNVLSPQIQELFIFPTEQCNFRCTYCYEDFEIGKMSEATQSALMALLAKRIPDLKQLRFSWFGGEPLMAKDVVLRLAQHAYDLCKLHGVDFFGGMTTNAALLNKDVAQRLIELRQDFFQITLDGTQEEHDKWRRRVDGKGTFDTIYQNLEAMATLPHWFEVVLRLHIRRDNLDDIAKLLAQLAKSFGADRRFRVDFQHLRDMGGEGGKNVIAPLSRTELLAAEGGLHKIWRDAVRASHPKLFAAAPQPQPVQLEGPPSPPAFKSESAGSQRASEAAAGTPYICYASKPNSLIVRANGRIGKCTVALDDPRNDLGYLAEDGSVVINQDKLVPWYRGLETLDPNVVGCPISSMPPNDMVSPIPAKVIQIHRKQAAR